MGKNLNRIVLLKLRVSKDLILNYPGKRSLLHQEAWDTMPVM